MLSRENLMTFIIMGKWGGGATNSSAFEGLSEEEQQNILHYLGSNKL